jgi:hypothetical protein
MEFIWYVRLYKKSGKVGGMLRELQSEEYINMFVAPKSTSF